MALPSEFEGFKDEADFISRFMIPLFQRLGLSVVCNYHGTREFGKDLLIGSLDCFGHVAYHGVQVKFVPSIGQTDSHGLVNDCREAFSNPFKHPHTGEEGRIGIFYAINGGSIADNARTHFFNSLQSAYGANVRMIDGKSLLALDRGVAIQRMDTVSALLQGLRAEMKYNSIVAEIMKQMLGEWRQDAKKPLCIERLWLGSCQQFLRCPLPGMQIRFDRIETYLVVADTQNRVLDRLLARDANSEALSALALSNCDLLLKQSAEISRVCESRLQELGPLVSL